MKILLDTTPMSDIAATRKNKGFTMLSKDVISALVDRIRDTASPERIYLFGSHAWGEPDKDSDVDLLVLVRESSEPPFRRAARMYGKIRKLRAPVELLVKTTGEFEEESRAKGSLARKILDNGRLLYGC